MDADRSDGGADENEYIRSSLRIAAHRCRSIKGCVNETAMIRSDLNQRQKALITIRFIGTGSAFSKKYGNTSALVTVTPPGGIPRRLLLDCGRTTPDDLVRAGLAWTDVDAIYISHLHGDHVFGLEEAGFMGRFVLNRKPHLIFPDEVIARNLWDHVLKGTMVEGDNIDHTLESYFTYETAEPETRTFLFNGIRFTVYRTEHVRDKRSYGVVIGDEGEIVYTADTLLNREQLEAFSTRGCQAIFHDCQLQHYEGQVHASLQELETLDEFVRSRTYLMHYGDTIETYRERIERSGFRIVVREFDYCFEISC